MFRTRSRLLERIDTGDYTPEEYTTFLREIRFINRYLGDARALKRSLFSDIEQQDLSEFSVLDVACGSGELLRTTAAFARETNRTARLTGIDLHQLSFSASAQNDPAEFPEIAYVRGDAFRLPFADGEFDYAISSLFFHHLTDEQIPLVLVEMTRVARRCVYVIDLERSSIAWMLFRIFCFAYRISPLVTHDGALSVKKGFTKAELAGFAQTTAVCYWSFPFRLVLSVPTPNRLFQTGASSSLKLKFDRSESKTVPSTSDSLPHARHFISIRDEINPCAFASLFERRPSKTFRHRRTEAAEATTFLAASHSVAPDHPRPDDHIV